MALIDEIRAVELGEGELAIFFLGQNSFTFKTPGGTLIALDPYFSRGPRYSYVHPEPPIRPEEVLVDYVFCTHDHLDHTDPDTLPAIAENSPGTLFLGPPESHIHFRTMGIDPQRSKGLEEGVTLDLADFKVTPLHSVPPSQARTTHYGYVFDFGFTKVYNMGDSSPGVVENPREILDPVARHSPEIAIFPIIGDFPGRKPEDAFLFTQILRPRVVIPCHYDCFTDRTLNPQVFADMFKESDEARPVIIDYEGKYIYRTPR
jgi:L-ascorbate 6-phosphate lactonase